MISMEYKLNLKKIREINSMSQKDFADILGIDRTVYNKYENEYELIPIKHLISLSNFFNFSLDYVLGIKDLNDNNLKYNRETDLKMIGARIQTWRKSNKLTQEKLAKELNTNKSVICNYEKGRNLIATPFLYQICKKYHVSADYLLGRIDKDPHK